jgi:23S rRNA pseudouridine1911/1915/1917 synthase
MNNYDIKIIYEDDNLLAINKPAGLVVHSDGKTKEYTLIDWIIENYPEIKNVGESVEYNGHVISRPGIVHRIDRYTSGVLLIAKTQDSFLYLKEQFKERNIKKIYKAIVYGNVKKDSGTIDRPIGRSSKDFRAWSAESTARGKLRDAITEYKTLKNSKNFSYLELHPKTGRTHQIRVHLKYIKHPIVCDSLYAPKKECALGLSRMALHAEFIEFTLLNGTKTMIEAPLPNDFEEALTSGELN